MTSKTLERSTVLSMLLVCLLWTTSSAQHFGRNKIQYEDHQWEILATPHFDIHFYEGSEQFAVRAALVLEDGYEMLSCKLREVLPWRVPVILYSSHNDFLQTNVTPQLLSEGVQAFAEPSRRRIVLPFTSSFKEFSHTAIHELAHVFTFQIVYNRMLDNVFTRNYLFPMPLWVAEGLAEYLAAGWDTDADMYIRDAVIHDYLYPFYAISGFYVYKEGQSVFNYIADTYGENKVLEMLDVLASSRSVNVALSRTIGLGTDELYERWSKSLRKHYWPLYPDKTEVEELGRRLTNHVKDRGYYNTKPVLSPDGERIAFFSDRSRFIEIYVMSALDGKIIRSLVSGARSNRFESLHILTSSLTWSPDGEHVAFVAKSSGHDALFIMNVESGDEERRIEIDAGQLSAPKWSPTENKVALSATFDGQTDLIVVDLDTGEYERLTDDPDDQLTPTYSPDGKRIVFVYYPEVTRPIPVITNGKGRDKLAEMDFLDPDNVRHDATYDIWEFDLVTGKQRPLIESSGDDTEPLVMADGKTIIYTSDRSGVNNLHAANTETGEDYRFTDVLGGLFTPTVQEQKGRIAFAGFVKGGYDIYISDDLSGMMARRYITDSAPVLAHPAEAKRGHVAPSVTVAGKKSPPTKAPAALDTAMTVAANDVDEGERTDRGLEAAANAVDTTVAGARKELSGPTGTVDIENYQARVRRVDEDVEDESEDTEGITREVPGEDLLFRGATISKYKTRLSPDFIGQGGGLYFSTGFGFGVANSIALSDMLGDHYLMFAFNFYRSFEDSDFLLRYYRLKGRIDYSFGAFHYKSFLDSRFTSVGEAFVSQRFFSERNYGIFGLMSVPFNKFYRMDLELQSYISDRVFYQDASSGGVFSSPVLVPSGTSSRQLIEPSISFVHDSSFFGPFGPVEGSRWRASASKAIGLGSGDRDVSRLTLYADYRWYQTLFYRNSIAFRLMGARSTGDDPRYFFIGGPLTLRGYDHLAFSGTRIGLTSIEYRFPLVDALIFGFPTRWGLTNIGGTFFWDAGIAWDKEAPEWKFDSTEPPYANFSGQLDNLNTIKSNIGVGTYFYVGYILFNMQFAWPIDADHISDNYQFHFYLGPTF